MENYGQANVENKRHFSIFSTNCIINKAILNLNKSEIIKKCPKVNNGSKVKLRSNSIFAFQNNDMYSNIQLDNNKVDDDRVFSDFEGSLNLFSNNDKSSSNVFLNLKNKDIKDSKDNSCSISSDIEKKLDFLDDLDLNDARIDFNYKFKSHNISNIKLQSEQNSLIHKIRENLSDCSGSEKSEKYDAVDEFSLEKADTKGKLGDKRWSAESGSLATQFASNPNMEKIIKTKLNNLCNTNNFESDFNKSNNSLEWSASRRSSASPSITYSPKKTKLSGFVGNTNINGFNNNSCSGNTNVLFISPSHPENFNSPLTGPNKNLFLLNSNKTQKPKNKLLHPNSINSSIDSFNKPLNLCDKNMNNRNQGRYSLNLVFDSNKNHYDQNNGNISPIMHSNYNHNSINFNTNLNNSGHGFQNSNVLPVKVNRSFINNQSYSPIYINNNIPNFLQDDNYVLENILTLLKDQNGCRMVQKKIEEKMHDYDYILQFYGKIEHVLNETINDQFGNYVVQKYFEIVQKDKFLVARFFEKINNNLYNISVNCYGTRFLQKALECLTPHYIHIETESLNNSLRELVENYIFELIIDTNGNHVFQKIVVLYPKDKNQFIYDQLVKNAYEISRLKQGGCIFQRAMDYANFDQKVTLVFEVLKNIDSLINDEYGNFIIQQIVFLRNPEFNEVISKYIRTNITTLSKKKFSSNVIDKCILCDDSANKNKLRNDIIDHLLNNKLVGELICDQFGNYVIQKCLQVTDGIRFMAIIFDIKSCIKILKQTAHGRKIYENLFMQYGDYFQNNKYKNTNDGRRNSHYDNFVLHNNLDK